MGFFHVNRIGKSFFVCILSKNCNEKRKSVLWYFNDGYDMKTAGKLQLAMWFLEI